MTKGKKERGKRGDSKTLFNDLCAELFLNIAAANKGKKKRDCMILHFNLDMPQELHEKKQAASSKLLEEVMLKPESKIMK